MGKVTLNCHGGANFIRCFCGYVGISHACNLVITGTITVDTCPKFCKVCLEELH